MASKPATTVTLKHLAASLAEDNELSKKQAEAILGGLVGNIVKHLKKGDRIRIGGLGILEVIDGFAKTPFIGNDGLTWFLLCWAVFTTYMFVASLRVSGAVALVFILLANGAFIAASRAINPDAWRRYVALLLDGCRPECARPLPARALSEGEMFRAMRQVRPETVDHSDESL